MKDRRKILYCGPSHRITPTLVVLANCLLSIESLAKEISMLNYGGHSKAIATFSRTAQAEVDKLIMVDNKEVESVEKTFKR